MRLWSGQRSDVGPDGTEHCCRSAVITWVCDPVGKSLTMTGSQAEARAWIQRSISCAPCRGGSPPQVLVLARLRPPPDQTNPLPGRQILHAILRSIACVLRSYHPQSLFSRAAARNLSSTHRTATNGHTSECWRLFTCGSRDAVVSIRLSRESRRPQQRSMAGLLAVWFVHVPLFLSFLAVPGRYCFLRNTAGLPSCLCRWYPLPDGVGG